MKKCLLIILFAFLVVKIYAERKVKPIIASQNFYNQNDIWDAIGKGIINFEADIMYIYGRNYVTRSMPDSINHQFPTFINAYLYPLYNQFKKNNGEIIPGFKSEIFLIVNFASTPLQVYNKLVAEMAPFKEMMTYQKDGKLIQGKARVLINDSNYYNKFKSKQNNFFGVVGKIDDIEKNFDSALMPLIEIDFEKITRWNGTGNIPYEDFVLLKNLVSKVHAQDKKLSIFNCPEEKSLFELLLKSKVDYIKIQNNINISEIFETLKY